MTNSRASGTFQKMEDYQESGTSALKTFSFTAIDWTKVSKLILEIDLVVSGALSLRMTVSGITTASSYLMDGRTITGGTETLVDAGVAFFELATAAMLAGDNDTVHLTVEIYQAPLAGSLRNSVTVTGNCMSRTDNINLTGTQTTSSTLTSIEIKTSTSTWKALSKMTLYKILR